MQTSTHETAPRRTTRRAAAPANRKPVYPEPTGTSCRLYWLRAYLRDLAEMEALDALHREAHRRNRSHVTCMALSGAVIHAREDAQRSLEHARRHGLLLFAHAHTTAFAGQQVPA